MIEAVIFDMDGILIDSEPFWREAEIEVFKQVNINLTEEDCLKTLGYRIDEVEDYWFAIQPWNNRIRGKIADLIVDKMVEYISTKGKPMPGVKHALQLVTDAGLPIALASSSHMRLIEAVLNRLNIKDYFKSVCSAEHEIYGKPHPAVFITAARELKVLPENCLIIEDSPSGIIAARASKATVIAIPEPHNAHQPEIKCAHFHLNSLNALSTDHLGTKS